MDLARFGQVYWNEPLSNHTSFRVGGPAKALVKVNTLVALVGLLERLNQEGCPYFILGKGSNLLVNDKGYPGVMIQLEMDQFYFGQESVLVEAGASLILLAHEAMKQSLGGLEFACGIPGSVGGALYMNAGAYQADMAQIVKRVLVLKEGQFHWLSSSDCHFGYRSSIFQKHDHWVICAAELELKTGDQNKIRELMEKRKQRRLASQPLDAYSAGSTFRNPDNQPAWQVIDQLGLRGYEHKGAMVSLKHSNFVVHHGQANAQAIAELIDLIVSRADKELGIRLIPEVERL